MDVFFTIFFDLIKVLFPLVFPETDLVCLLTHFIVTICGLN